MKLHIMNFRHVALVTFTAFIVSGCGSSGSDSETPNTPIVEQPPVNNPPTVDNIANQQVNEGDSVSVSATSSDGESEITHTWERVGGLDIDFDGANTPSISFVAPNVTEESTVEFTYTATDNEGLSASVSVTITILDTNTAPIANAGNDRTLSISGITNLDGSASIDPDGDNITFTWSIVSQPEQANIVIDQMNEVNPSVNLSLEGSYVFNLLVSDGALSDQDTVILLFENSEHNPIINQFTYNYRGEEGSKEIEFIWDVEDPNGDSLTCFIDIESDNDDDYIIESCDMNSSLNHNFSSDGNYEVRLRIVDSKNNESEIILLVSIYSAPADSTTSLVGPVSLGMVQTPDFAEGVLVDGNIAYVADFESGVQIVDVTRPESPRIISFIDTAHRALDVALSNDKTILFVGDSQGLYSIDVSNPISPKILQHFMRDSLIGRRIALEGDKLYAASFDGLVVLDTSSASNMQILGSYSLDNTLAVVDLYVKDSIVYMGLNGLQTFDATDPSNIKFLSSIYTNILQMYIADDIAYIAANDEGMRVVDIRDPESMSEITVFEASSQLVRNQDVTAVLIENNLAFLGTDESIQIWDLEDVQNPVLLGQTFSQLDTRGLDKKENLLYVSGGTGLQIFDVSSPESLVASDTFIRDVETISEEAIENDTIVFGRYYMYDVFQPSDTKRVDLPSYQQSLAHNKMIYGINRDLFTITDYSNPNSAVIVSQTTLPSIRISPRLGDLRDNLVTLRDGSFLTSYGNGIAQIINVVDPENPTVQTIDLALFGYSNIFDINGNLAYAAVQNGQLAIVDINDLNNPIELSRLDVEPERIIIEGNNIFTVDSQHFSVFNIESVDTPKLERSFSVYVTNFMQKVNDIIFIGIGQSGFGAILAVDVSMPEAPSYTYLESGSNTTETVEANQNILVGQSYDPEATRVYDFSLFLKD